MFADLIDAFGQVLIASQLDQINCRHVPPDFKAASFIIREFIFRDTLMEFAERGADDPRAPDRQRAGMSVRRVASIPRARKLQAENTLAAKSAARFSRRLIYRHGCRHCPGSIGGQASPSEGLL